MPQPINKTLYLKDSLAFNDRELTFIKEFSDWLPEKIIDAHVHCNLEEHVLNMSDATYAHMISTFPSFSLEESRQLNALFYPIKKVFSLRFPHVYRGLNHKAANQYLLDNSDKDDRVAIFGLPEDIPYTVEMLSHPKVSGLKMYYSYTEPTAKTIYECFPREVLREAEKLGVPIILHLPQIITKSKDDLLQVVKDFPTLKIVVPHLGSTKFVVPNLKETYEELASKTNIFLDTSLNPSQEVVALALSAFGENRILFGSDAPLNLLRSVPYIHPEKGQRIVTSYKYHWIDTVEYTTYGHLAQNAVHAHWVCLMAIRTVVESYPVNLQEQIKEKIFYENAKKLFHF